MPHEKLLFSLLDEIQNTKKMNTRESKERKFLLFTFYEMIRSF